MAYEKLIHDILPVKDGYIMGTEFTDLYAPQAAIIKTEVPDAETEETPTVSNEAKVINSANTKFWDFFIASGI